jgi:hypothetical protein
LTRNLSAWVKGGGESVLTKKPKRDARSLAEIRGLIASKKAQIDEQLMVWHSASEAREAVRANLAQRVEQVHKVLRRRVADFASGHGHADHVFRPPREDNGETAGFLAALVGIDRVMEMLDPGFQTLPEIDRAERSRRRAELDAEIFELELREEALVCEAEERGEDVMRRPNANPSAVLAIAG